ncbi:MAG: tRNA-dihydrouridine synthase family protein [Verrucomicrobiota bacterium]
MRLPWFNDNAFPLYLAPMAGFTDTVFRQLCRQEGADVVISEFVLADSLIYGNEAVWETVDFSENQRPMGIQIFGSSPEIMAEAARRLVDRHRPDFIDLNFGCPSDKVTCRDAGSSLLRNPKKLESVARGVVQALPDLPVTGKIRLGWDHESIVALDVSRRLEDSGIQAVAIHGRTKEQGYTGNAEWDPIFEVAEHLTIPVICNGDISSARDIAYIRENSKVRGAMIGRAALGYPWLFREIKHVLTHGSQPPALTLADRWNTILNFAEMMSARPARQKFAGSLRWMRPKLAKLTKDMTACKKARGGLAQVITMDDLKQLAVDHTTRYTEADAAINLQAELEAV